MLNVSDLFKIKNCEVRSIGKNELSFKKKYKGVSIDSRNVKRGEIFFAIKGENTDGHRFLKEASANGAEAFVISKKWFNRNKNSLKGGSYFLTDDTTLALGEFANIHRNRFSIPVICIGGSNGKTTTKDLTAAVLSQKYNVLKTEGNFNNHIGLPLTLLRLRESHEICVLEAGCNHFGEMNYLCKVAEPQYGMITNIGKEHLEFFRNLKGVVKAEFELYEYLKHKKSSYMFFNKDDEFIRNFSKDISRKKKLTYAYGYNADVRGKFAGYNEKFQPGIEIAFGKLKFRIEISTFGKHSIYNGLSAASIGLHFKISPGKISNALKNFKPASSKRMEIINHKGVTYINDTYNSNPESVRMGLDTLMEYKSKGRKFAVISDMLELGKSSRREHTEAGKYAAALKPDFLITTGKESEQIFKGARELKNNIYFKEKESMITMLKAVIKRGDVVYVKGSRGMKMEDVISGIIN
ncbi:MAG: UDP-N-acetylmuramoyl-tripeptide--D-alanyl-D-alanine ligase [Ignavibacteria bacterium]|nr:UDP-N-acetylmuramoyl-tripeptide--D-alanyl-D-alanine ligase [Ignavibacteria bacterium]